MKVSSQPSRATSHRVAHLLCLVGLSTVGLSAHSSPVQAQDVTPEMRRTYQADQALLRLRVAREVCRRRGLVDAELEACARSEAGQIRLPNEDQPEDEAIRNRIRFQEAITGIRHDADDDIDGLLDMDELVLAAKWAPEVRLAGPDWTRPANVDWYLSQVRMRYHRSNRGDLELLAVGQVNQESIRQATAEGSLSTSSNNRFFLQPPNNDVHRGAPSHLWRSYVHVSPSRFSPDGVDIQYWFFYPYNDAFASFNHEGDWEHVSVTVNRDGSFHSMWFSQHDGGTRYAASQVHFADGTHPVVYVAKGSHANYPTVGTFRIAGTPVHDRTYADGPRWDVRGSFVNVGERGRPLNGQNFILYGGRWGEVGMTGVTSGPQGPAFQAAW